MITLIVCIVIGIAMFAAIGNGEWGSVAVGAVIVLLLIGLRIGGRKGDQAYNNAVDYWADGGRNVNKRTRR